MLLWEIYSFGRVPYPRIPLGEVVKHVEKGIIPYSILIIIITCGFATTHVVDFLWVCKTSY